MIELPELKRASEFLDTFFKFKIGDIVQPAALGDYLEKPTGIGTSSRDDGKSWTFSLAFCDNFRYQIVERLLQQCHGGIQRHYQIRLIANTGGIEKQLFQSQRMS